jgi:hypothetical protein
MEQLLIHILVRHLMRNSDTSIRSAAALRLSDGVPAEVAPYLKVRMKLPTPDFIDCAGRKYDRQVDRKAAALCMKFTMKAQRSCSRFQALRNPYQRTDQLPEEYDLLISMPVR